MSTLKLLGSVRQIYRDGRKQRESSKKQTWFVKYVLDNVSVEGQKFKKLARMRLREGRLIKLENEFGIDKVRVKAKRDPIETILQNLVYISFDQMLHSLFVSFQKFMRGSLML